MSSVVSFERLIAKHGIGGEAPRLVAIHVAEIAHEIREHEIPVISRDDGYRLQFGAGLIIGYTCGSVSFFRANIHIGWNCRQRVEISFSFHVDADFTLAIHDDAGDAANLFLEVGFGHASALHLARTHQP